MLTLSLYNGSFSILAPREKRNLIPYSLKILKTTLKPLIMTSLEETENIWEHAENKPKQCHAGRKFSLT
jgi:hypothetical protein